MDSPIALGGSRDGFPRALAGQFYEVVPKPGRESRILPYVKDAIVTYDYSRLLVIVEFGEFPGILFGGHAYLARVPAATQFVFQE